MLLLHCCTRYRRLSRRSSGEDIDNARGFRAAVLDAYEDAYRKFGREVNTPAIIEEVIANRLSGRKSPVRKGTGFRKDYPDFHKNRFFSSGQNRRLRVPTGSP